MQRGLWVAGAVALTTISALAFDWREVTVESHDGKRVYKRVDHNGRVRLTRRLSDKACVQNRSWGYDRNGIWVDNGCRAVFEYETGRNTGGGIDLPGILRPGSYDTTRFKLESTNDRRVTKRIDTSGGVRLTKKLSDAPCVQGRTWGYSRTEVWVDDGCRAEFEVRSRRDDSDGRDPWLPGRGVPNWAVGTWDGQRRSAQNLELRIRSDGSLTLRRRNELSEGRRGEVRGNRVEIGNDIYRLEKDGKDSIVLIPVRTGTGAMYFSRG